MKNKIYKFMYGRYGEDNLFYFLFTLSVIFICLNLFINSNILTIIELILYLICLYRFLSKNKIKRKKENDLYLNIKDKIINYFNYQRRKYKDRNSFMYKRCPHCKQRLRLPLKKGTHTVKCPKCKESFKVNCKKNEKIKVEIVK